jgi:hypothetical protein
MSVPSESSLTFPQRRRINSERLLFVNSNLKDCLIFLNCSLNCALTILESVCIVVARLNQNFKAHLSTLETVSLWSRVPNAISGKRTMKLARAQNAHNIMTRGSAAWEIELDQGSVANRILS